MATKILIVEDTDDIRDALVIALTEAGFRVAAAARGEEAFEELSTFTPDIVLLDMHLPGMSGLDILKRLRETLSVPILMFTSSGDAGIVRDAITSGATDYVLKDTGMDELIDRVNKHLGQPRPAEVVRPAPVKSTGSRTSIQVLYVGQDTEVMRLVTATSIRLAVESTRVSTAKAAMSRMSKDRPSIVVTELELRDSDGLSLLKAFISETSASTRVPVIMVADSAPPEKRRRALSLGAAAFYMKPVDAMDFEQAVRKMLRNIRSAGAA